MPNQRDKFRYLSPKPLAQRVGVETEREGAEVPARRVMLRERGQEPRCWTIQSQTERRDRGQTEKSWLLLFEGVDTSLYDITENRKSKLGTEIAPLL